MKAAALGFFLSLASTFGYAQTSTSKSCFEKGVLLRDRGNKPGALEQFRRAAALDPKFPFVYREIGIILLDRRDFQGAAAAFRKATEQNPQDFDSRYNLALSLANAGRRRDGIREIDRALREKPGWGLGFFGLGHMCALDGQMERAEQAYRTALNLDPSLGRAHFELGKLLEQKGDREGAIHEFEAAVRISPDSSAARYRLGVLLRQAGDAGAASREFTAVQQMRESRTRGEQAATAYKQALALIERNEFEAAIRELRMAATLRPDLPEIRSALVEAHEQFGLALEKRHQIPEAIAQYREALKLEPRARTHNHVGVLLVKSGRVDAAIESFRAALEVEPGFRNAQVNLKQALGLRGRSQ